MDLEEFKSLLLKRIKPGREFPNPLKGTSLIKSMSEKGIYYIRGNSTIQFNFKDMYDAYQHFKGKKVTTNDLKKFRAEVFDSFNQDGKRGHGCNCTTLFLILKQLQLCSPIHGQGKQGDPFYVMIK